MVLGSLRVVQMGSLIGSGITRVMVVLVSAKQSTVSNASAGNGVNEPTEYA